MANFSLKRRYSSTAVGFPIRYDRMSFIQRVSGLFLYVRARIRVRIYESFLSICFNRSHKLRHIYLYCACILFVCSLVSSLLMLPYCDYTAIIHHQCILNTYCSDSVYLLSISYIRVIIRLWFTWELLADIDNMRTIHIEHIHSSFVIAGVLVSGSIMVY